MARSGSRAGGHRIPPAPSTRSTPVRPASAKDPDNGPAHPTSRKPTGGGGGHGGGQGNSK